MMRRGTRRRSVDTDEITIQVQGPKQLLPQPKVEKASKSMTWMHFLSSKYGLKLDSNSPYFICNVKYKPGSGWTAGLNEQIGSIMDNFTRNRGMYCVKLASGTRLQPFDNNEEEEETCNQSPDEESDEEVLTVPIRVAPAGTNLVKKVNGPVRKFASAIPITPEKFQNVSSSMHGPTIVIPLSSGGPRGGNSLQPILLDQQLTHQKSNGGTVPTDIRTMEDITEGSRYRATNCAGTNDLNPPPVKLIRMESPPVAGSSRQSEWQSRSVARVSNYEEDNYPDSPDFNLRIDRITGQNGVYDIANIKQERNTDFYQNGQNNGLPMQPPFQPDTYCPSVLEIEEDEDSDADYYDDDNDSLCTTATTANRELREAGINFRDLKSGLAAKLEKMDEAMLNRVHREIRKLKAENNWNRNVRRSPLGCYLLSELFKD